MCAQHPTVCPELPSDRHLEHHRIQHFARNPRVCCRRRCFREGPAPKSLKDPTTEGGTTLSSQVRHITSAEPKELEIEKRVREAAKLPTAGKPLTPRQKRAQDEKVDEEIFRCCCWCY